MPKTKKFIDRKNAVTFHLVHRSQQDPLAADEDAPQHVLLQVDKKKRQKVDGKKRLEEQHKYGIYFDDDYDYMQHLREASEFQQTSWIQVPHKQDNSRKKDNNETKEKVDKLNLPKEVFASETEEKVGLLNKAAPQGLNLDLDPDIVMAMDDDFDFNDPENELEDNFIELANVSGSDYEDDDVDEHSMSSDMNDGYTSEERDEVRSLDNGEYTFRDEEVKSRFTEYSMSSSVMRRNEQLTLIDERFEKMYENYDDNEIGALDTEEIEGHVDPNADILMQCVDQFEKMKEKKTIENDSEALRNQMFTEQISSNDEAEDDLIPFDITEQQADKWDCESILTTYSNVYNHPKLIVEPKVEKKIRINPKTGIPLDVLNNKKQLTAKALAQLNSENESMMYSQGPKSVAAESVVSRLSVLSIRNKDETPEEKKQRKKLLKEYRKERRLERKANTEAFKEEKKRQEKILMNNKVNVQTIK